MNELSFEYQLGLSSATILYKASDTFLFNTS